MAVHYVQLGVCFLFISVLTLAASEPDCCPTFWTRFGSSCYRYIAKPLTWQDAEDKCLRLGRAIEGMEGHLVSIHSEEENRFIRQYSVDYDVPKAGRRGKIRESKVTSDSALWIGLSDNEGDTTTKWSDDTTISCQFWRYGSYVMENNCGVMWNGRSKFKGMWENTTCSATLPSVCKLTRTLESRTNNSNGEEITQGRTCSYRGTKILHGNVLVLDVCTSCTCDDGVVKCDIKSCQPTFCQDTITLEDQCCNFCPYYNAVYEMSALNVRSVNVGAIHDVNLDLKIKLNEDSQGAVGNGIWKVSMWASANEDGSGQKVGFQEQVFTDEQASEPIYRPALFGGFVKTFRDINVTLDTSEASVDDITYFCASFSKGDAPQLEYEQLPFTVVGVESETETTPNPGNLVVCQTFENNNSNGEEITQGRTCTYRGTKILHGNVLVVDSCISCSCDDGVVKCDIKSCQPIFCDGSDIITLENQCCEFCPYYNAVYEMNALNVRSINVGAIHDVNLDLRIKLNDRSLGAVGNGIWKVSMWASANEDGAGQKVGFQEQVLTNEQASEPIYRPPLFGGFVKTFRDINVILDTSEASVDDITYFCASFSKGDAPQLEYDQLPFTVLGVESVTETTPNPGNLVVCQTLENNNSNGEEIAQGRTCSYRGTKISHGNALIVDLCTSCSCDDGVVKCDIKRCPPTFCRDTITLEDQCCNFCPYYNAVYEMSALNVRSVNVGAIHDVNLDLKIKLNGDSQGAVGNGIWKVSVWASANADGAGRKVGYQGQVLTVEQASEPIYHPQMFGGFVKTFRDINVTLETSEASVDDITYFCASFSKGDAPQLEYEQLPFTVVGVESETETTPNPGNLVVCQTFDFGASRQE